jgi:hypothetical protein
MMYYWNGGRGDILLAMALNIAFWTVLLGLLIWGVRRIFSPRGGSSGSGSSGPSDPSAPSVKAGLNGN